MQQLLSLLSDGKFHSGEALAEVMGCTRSAVWKQVDKLRQVTGLTVDAVSGRGYRLRRPIELLDSSKIEAAVVEQQLDWPDVFTLVASTESTNAMAQQALAEMTTKSASWLAEHQSAGRGRRGRVWQSPYGSNLYFSLAYRFALPIHQLAGLSLATGIVIAEVLKSAGLRTPQLKWPNDIYAEDKKLGGILIEVSGEATAGAMAVIGVGINIDHQSLDQASIDQPITSLREQQVAESRNVLAARLISAVIRMAKDFEQTGLKGFVDRWPEFDAFKDRRVALTGPGVAHYGICRGIAEDGGLRLETDSGEQVFYGGELSLRLG